jgi:hypothetical protein
MTQPPVPPAGAGRSRGAPADTKPADTQPADTGLASAGLFEVVRGTATAEEIAALTAVLAALAAAGRQDTVPAGGPAARSNWADRSRLMRRPLAHAPGAWRASAR